MKALILFLTTVTTLNSFAAIVCHTPRMNKNFELNDNKISFFNDADKFKKREIASLYSRNKSEAHGITKIVEFENQKHTIHIDNVNNFSDVDDYMIIKNKAGHEITYPLSCSNK